MLKLMRDKGFLHADHRNSETLRNVLGEGYEDLEDSTAQSLIFKIENHGKKTAELHASAILPDLFGSLSDADIKEYFNGKRFKGPWTKQRHIRTAGYVMVTQRQATSQPSFNPTNDPKKTFSERRHTVTKLMKSLTLAEHAAIKGGDMEGAEHARRKWHVLHSARYLMSPFADAYRSSDRGVRHAKKSQILSALDLDRFEEIPEWQVQTQPMTSRRKSVSFYYEYQMPQYASVMVDVMNHIRSRGTDGRRGNSLFHVTLLKLKHLPRPWFTGRRSRNLKQLHLHIDDPFLVIPQKRGEQSHSDSARLLENEDSCVGDEELEKIGFLLPVDVLWAMIISSRSSRDSICSLHFFCGGVAALELSDENNLNVDVFLYGGCFCFKSSCVGTRPQEILPQLSSRCDKCGNPRDGEVLLFASPTNIEDKSECKENENCLNEKRQEHRTSEGEGTREEAFSDEGGATNADPSLRIPRSRVLVLSKQRGLEISQVTLSHGESETRFVAAFHKLVTPMLTENNFCEDEVQNMNNQREGPNSVRCGCVIVSKDTDVTMILALSGCLHGKGVVHVLGESVIEVDTMTRNLSRRFIDTKTLSSVYVLAGCDFTAGKYGVTHEHYLNAAIKHRNAIGVIDFDTAPDVFELLTLLAYLEKLGLTNLVTVSEKETMRQQWNTILQDDIELRKRMRCLFVSEHCVGSNEWRLDVRRFVADHAKSATELIPPAQHVFIQARRVKFVVFTYWSRLQDENVSGEVVRGCDENNGFTISGYVLLEREEDVTDISKRMRELVAKCGCKGACSNRQCSCVKRDEKCVGCECDPSKCQNKVTCVPVEAMENSSEAENVEGAEGVDEVGDRLEEDEMMDLMDSEMNDIIDLTGPEIEHDDEDTLHLLCEE